MSIFRENKCFFQKERVLTDFKFLYNPLSIIRLKAYRVSHSKLHKYIFFFNFFFQKPFFFAEPKTAILGGPDIHLKEGSTMNLSCIITDSPEPPSYIFWRHDDAVSTDFVCKQTAENVNKLQTITWTHFQSWSIQCIWSKISTLAILLHSLSLFRMHKIHNLTPPILSKKIIILIWLFRFWAL